MGLLLTKEKRTHRKLPPEDSASRNLREEGRQRRVRTEADLGGRTEWGR